MHRIQCIEWNAYDTMHVIQYIQYNKGCFTMDANKVFGYFSGYEASSDLKHVAKFS